MNSLSLNLTLHCGRDLPKADLLSSIDAYAVIILPIIGGQTKTFKTKIVQNDPNPDWEFDLFCTDVDGTRDCLVEIWDEDTLRNEKVCTASLSLVDLRTLGVWNGKHVILKCLPGFKPNKGASESSIIVSASAHVSFADLTFKITSPHKFVDPSKKTIVFPFSPNGDNTLLYVKISAGKRFKISILDTSEYRTKLVMFEVAGKNITSEIIKFKEPKKKYGICYYRKIKMKKSDIKSWSSVNLVVSNCSLVSTKSVEAIVNEHGWFGSMTFEQAKTRLKNIVVDQETKSIFMLESNYSYMVDFDSDNFDQKVCLSDEFSLQGYHVEFVYAKGNRLSITSHGEPRVQTNTRVVYRYSSQVKDSEYGTPFFQFSIELYHKVQPQLYKLNSYIPLSLN